MDGPAVSLRLPLVICALTLTALVGVSDSVWAMEGSVRTPLTSGCPDLIDLIKELTPVVVNISIERDIVQKSSTAPPPLFRPRPGRVDDQSRVRDRFQTDSLGSGFFCDTEGHIITNAHVVDGANKILVTVSSGKVYQAKTLGIHPNVDLALIKINPQTRPVKAKIGDSDSVQVGEWVLAVGNPFGLGRTVTIGIVSGKGRFIGLGAHDNFIQTDASINPGNSGGPLFNMAGEVIGVNTAIIAAGRGIGFSIPANYIKELIKSKGTTEPPIRGWLGVYVDDVTTEQARALGLGPERGTVVDEVLNATPAYTSGLRKGDVILEADGRPIRNGRHLSEIVAHAKPGDVVKITVLRGKQNQTIDVVIGKSPE